MKRLTKVLPARLSKEIEVRTWAKALRNCPLFNGDWYLKNYQDVKEAGVPPLTHYLKLGWKELRNPSAEFDSTYYVTRYPDIASIGMPPLVHYWLHGRHEGRHLNPSLDLEWISAQHGADRGSPIESAYESAEPDQPYISVIIPTYNRLSMLPDVIAAWRLVNKNTSLNYEIIFSDDGSEDASVEYLKTVQDLPIVILENEHGGASPARNAAIKIARGERLLIIGDDIFPDPQLLNVHASKAKELGRKVAILGVVDWAPNLVVNHLMDHITEIGNEQFSYNRLPNENFVDFRHFYTCNICIDRKLVIDNDIIFDDRFDEYGFEDIELGYRLSLKGLKIYYTQAAKGDHFHPYIVDGFCKRQIRSGRMAVVFRDAHPGVGKILGVDLLHKALVEFGPNTQPHVESAWEQRLKAMIEHCNYLEQMIVAGGPRAKSTIGRYLSYIYSTLFRSMYEFGVLQKISGRDNVLSVAMSRNFGSEWAPYWDILINSARSDTEIVAKDVEDCIAHHTEGNLTTHLPEIEGSVFYTELAVLRKILDHPVPLSVKKARFQRKAVMALHYLVKDPRYLLKRLLQVSNAPVNPPALTPHQMPATEIAHSLALVIDDHSKESQQLIERFRLAFGDTAPIYTIEETTRLVADKSVLSLQVKTSFFWPSSLASFPDKDTLLAGWLAVEENDLDIALISYNLQSDGTIGLNSLRDQLVFSDSVAEIVINGKLLESSVRGKLIRTLRSADPDEVPTRSLASMFTCKLTFDPAHCFFSTGRAERTVATNERVLFPIASKNRPVIFVFPIFVAVGGVERNTIEIIRKLDSHYDFIVITMERLRAEQGSLIGQFREAGARVIEMSEIVPHAKYMSVLTDFKTRFNPDLIWVCNGSPWFCDNAANIRSLFSEIPIVDQEVYDVNEGWINRYSEPGIKSFDRFIAINNKIRNKFITEIGIPEAQVDLIYSALDTSKVLDFKKKNVPRHLTLENYGLPANKKLFTFVGRLTSQKRPIEFLKIAKTRLLFKDEAYVLVGDGELAQECEKYIAKNNLTNVIRIPFVDNTLALASVSTGLIITSAYEGLPIAMLEVLNFGVPVFATDTGDIRMVLDAYSAGMVVPVECDDVCRGEAYIKWVSDLDFHRSAIESAAQELLERFSSDSISNQYIDCFTTANTKNVEHCNA